MSAAAPYPIERPRVVRRPVALQPTAFPWRHASIVIALVMLLAVFEGAGRKWLFPSVPQLRYLAYFAKDIVFVLVAYWGLKRGRRFDLQWMTLCAILILIPSAASTMANSNLVGMALSFRAYLVLPLCAFLAAPLIRNFVDVERCAIVAALAVLPVAVLGVYQYSLPKHHILNRYDSGAEDSYGIERSGHVRAAGTFAYIGGMGVMASFSAWAGMYLVFPIAGRPSWVRALGLAAVVAGLVCGAVAMSRSGVIFWFITVAGSLLLYLRANHIFIASLAMLSLASAFFSTDTIEDLDVLTHQDSIAVGVVNRFQTSDSVISRVQYMAMNLMLGVTNHPIGEGLGTGQPGGHYVATGVQDGAGYESEWGRIAYEIGPLGLLGALLTRFMTGLICWRALFQTTNNHRRLILATALPFFACMSVGRMAFNHTGNTMAWAVIALALAAVPTDVRKTP